MAFQVPQFKDFIEDCAAAWDSANGLSQPATDTPDLDAVQLFSSYSATVGSANLSATYKTHPASPYVWISGKPDPNGNFGMFMGNNAQRITFHDAYFNPNPTASTVGHGIAITPRHVICGVHGNETANATLQWVLSDGTVISRSTHGSYYRDNIGVSGSYGFRLLYLDQDLPIGCVCPLLHLNDAPDLEGAWLVCYNNFREMTVWEIVDAELNAGSYYYMSVKKPTDSLLAKLWRPFNCGSAYGTQDLQSDAGSGSPFFLVFTNSVGQTQFVWFGSAVASSTCASTAAANSYLHYHDDIIDALHDLNDDTGSDYVPKYVTDGPWFAPAIEDDLNSYWKMNESSGNRADTHGSDTLVDNNTVGSASGKVYSLAAVFVTENVEFLRTSGPYWFSGDITICAWIMPLTNTTGLHGVITRDSLDQDSDWALFYDDEVFRFRINGNSNYEAVWPTTASNSTWYHVAAWWDAANHTVNIQVNNGDVVSTDCGSTDRNWNGDNPRLTFGAFDPLSGDRYPWDGRIGPAAIWNRLLTADERAALYNAGNGVTYPFPILSY